MVISLIVGTLFGWIIGLIYQQDIARSRTRFMIAGFVGAWMGNYFGKAIGPSLYGFAPIPTILVAGILIASVWGLLSQVTEE